MRKSDRIILLTQGFIPEHIVGISDCLELLLCCIGLLGVLGVGVVFLGQFVEFLLYFFLGCKSV
jgi:hypothetical protein